MADLFGRIVDMSIWGGILMLIIMILRPFIRKAPAWVFPLIWEIASLKLLIPFSINVDTGIFKKREIIGTTAMRYYGSDISKSVLPTAGNTADGITGNISGNITVVPQDAIISGTDRMIEIGTVIWVTGVILMLTYMIVSYVMLRRRLKNAACIRDNIYTDRTVISPFVFGLIRPSIYLPEGGISGLDNVIRHEKAHIERLDHILKMIGFAVLSVHWFNPLIWAAYHFFSQDMELACDERAVRDMDDEGKADYSQILLDQQRKVSVNSLCPVAFSETGLRQRVKRILTVKKTVRAVGVSAILCILTLTACFFTKENKGVNETLPEYRYTWVKEYEPEQEGIISNADVEKFRNKSRDLDIGATEEGAPVFKDPSKAFETIKRLYKDEIIKTREVNDLPELSESTYLQYQFLAWQTVTAQDKDSQKFAELSALLQIYNNSFDISDIVGAPDMRLHNKYVTNANLYMNPLSSFMPQNGDSMEDYFVSGDTFTIKHRGNGNEKVIRNVKWIWKSPPWTEAEWRKMFIGTFRETFHFYPSVDRYIKLDDEYCLISQIGTIYLIKINNTGNDGPFIWSIYRIEPQDR